MALRFYTMPKIGTGAYLDPFRPKYIDGLTGGFVAMDYGGGEDLFLVGANVTPAEHTAIAAHSDVLAVPADLTNTVSAPAVTIIQNRLEAARLPADWVTTALTYRQVLRITIRLMLLRQRFRGRFGALFATGITLDSPINDLPVETRQNLNTAAQSLGADTSSIAGTTLIRQALKIVADQIFPKALAFGGEKF